MTLNIQCHGFFENVFFSEDSSYLLAHCNQSMEHNPTNNRLENEKLIICVKVNDFSFKFFKGHKSSIKGLKFLSANRTISWSADTISLWDLKDDSSSILNGHTGNVDQVHVLGDKLVLSWASNFANDEWCTEFIIWNLEANSSKVFKIFNGLIKDFELIDDEKLLIHSHSLGKHNQRDPRGDNCLSLWNLKDGSAQVLSWSFDTALSIWNLKDGSKKLFKSLSHKKRFSIGFSYHYNPHTKSVSGDHLLDSNWALSLDKKRVLSYIKGQTSDKISGVHLVDNKRILTWSENSTFLRYWDLDVVNTNFNNEPLLEENGGGFNNPHNYMGSKTKFKILFNGNKTKLGATAFLINSNKLSFESNIGESLSINGHLNPKDLTWTKSGYCILNPQPENVYLKEIQTNITAKLIFIDDNHIIAYKKHSVCFWDLKKSNYEQFDFDYLLSFVVYLDYNRIVCVSNFNQIEILNIANRNRTSLGNGIDWTLENVFLANKSELILLYIDTIGVLNINNGHVLYLADTTYCVDGEYKIFKGVYNNVENLIVDTESFGQEIINGVKLINKQKLVAWQSDGRVFLWDFKELKYHPLGYHSHDVKECYRINKKYLATISYDKTDPEILVTDLSNNRTKSLSNHKDIIIEILIINNHMLLSYSADGKIIIWDLKNNSSNIIDMHYNLIKGVLINFKNKLISWSEDATIRLWCLSTQKLLNIYVFEGIEKVFDIGNNRLLCFASNGQHRFLEIMDNEIKQTSNGETKNS